MAKITIAKRDSLRLQQFVASQIQILQMAPIMSAEKESPGWATKLGILNDIKMLTKLHKQLQRLDPGCFGFPLREPAKCPECNGNGRVEMLEHCPTCGGKGSV